MKVSEMFPRKYATGEDLQGKPVTVTVAQVVKEEMRPQPSAPPVRKWVVYFHEAQKGVVLSRTLAYQIAEAADSDETNDWTDRKVTLYPKPMMVAGKKRIAIRARAASIDDGDTIPPRAMEPQDTL